MTKIEELAKEATRKEYLCERCAWKDNCDHCGGQNTAFDCCECPADSYEDGFKDGANALMSLPLASRLTAEEKESVRMYHKLASYGYWECNCADKAVAKVLESIFGSDFFKEEGD